MAYELVIQEPSDLVIAQAVSALRQAGFRVEQSFALRDACHYTVLLVYCQDQCAPSTVLVHGYEASSRIVLPDNVGANIKHHADIYSVLSAIEAKPLTP